MKRFLLSLSTCKGSVKSAVIIAIFAMTASSAKSNDQIVSRLNTQGETIAVSEPTSPNDVDVIVTTADDVVTYRNGESNLTETTNVENVAPSESDGTSPSDFSMFGVMYIASFKSFGHGQYGFKWESFSNKGWGMTLKLGMDFGMKMADSLCWYFGPTYGYPINKYIMPYAKVQGFVNVPTKSNYAVSGGMYFTPAIMFKLGKVKLNVGYNLGFASGSQIGTGFAHNFEIGIGL